jgi:hypothetical protein
MTDEFDFFKRWMKENPTQWVQREDVDFTVPLDFKYTFGRELIPVYLRFLNEIGALKLHSFRLSSDESNPSVGYEYCLLTPKEIIDEFVNSVIRWNNPEVDFDFGYLMPFCMYTAAGSLYCFDIGFPADDDSPIVSFAPMCAIPGDELKIATSFKQWLKKMAKYWE